MATDTLQHESAPAITRHPLEPVAPAWLARWTRFGASAYLSRVCDVDDGPAIVEPELVTCFPTYDCSPVYQDDEELIGQAQGWPESLLRDRRSFNAHFYDSKVRELYDLLAAVQGGCDAVQSD